MAIPSADAIASLIISDIDAIPLNLPEAEAKRQTYTAIAQRIRDAVLAATLTVPAAGLLTGPSAGSPVTGVATTGTLS